MGLTQQDVVARLQVKDLETINQTRLSKIERGVRGVHDYELKKFAEALGVTADYLLESSTQTQQRVTTRPGQKPPPQPKPKRPSIDLFCLLPFPALWFALTG